MRERERAGGWKGLNRERGPNYGSPEESRAGQAGGGVSLDDRVQFQGLADSDKLHLAGLLSPPGAPAAFRKNFAQGPPLETLLNGKEKKKSSHGGF